MSAVPSRLLNGSSPLHPPSGGRDARERESLNSSIRSSFAPRVPVEFDQPESAAAPAGDSGNAADGPVPSTEIAKSVPIVFWLIQRH